MKIIVGLLALLIFSIYSLYFVRIIRGCAEQFETELSAALKLLLDTGKTGVLWRLWWVSLAIEILYFGLVLMTLHNVVVIVLTATMMSIEVWHLTALMIRFRAFFQGRIDLEGVLNWRLERISAMGFFTHSLIVLVALFL